MLLPLLLACAPESPSSTPTPVPPVDATGPWTVGSLEEVAINGDVSLALQVWFPATDADEEPYRYDDFYASVAREDAVPACDSPRPVVLFSHGNGGMRWQSVFLAEHLASHGWIVAAPDHTGNTFFDARQLPRSELLLRRPRDIAASWERLLELARDDGPLAGCVDAADGFAAVGHSFGGYTTLAVAGAYLDGAATAEWCAANPGGWLCEDVAAAVGTASVDLSHPDAWAAVPMAPAGYEALLAGLPVIDAPTLVLGGDLDTLTTMAGQVRPIFEALATRRALGTVEGAGHYTFSDACSVLGGGTTYPDCAPPHVDVVEAHRIVNGATLAWLSHAHGEDLWPDWTPGDGLTWEAP